MEPVTKILPHIPEIKAEKSMIDPEFLPKAMEPQKTLKPIKKIVPHIPESVAKKSVSDP